MQTQNRLLDDIARLANGVEPTFVRRSSLVFFARLMADEDMDMIGGLSAAISFDRRTASFTIST